MTVSVESPTSSVDLVGRPAVLKDGGVMTTVTAVRGFDVFTAREPGQARPGGDVVTLPVVGELVDDGDAVRGYWLGLLEDAAVCADGRLEASVLSGSEVRTVSVEPSRVDARRVVTGRATEGERAAMSALLAEARAHRRTQQAHQARIDRLVEDAHEWADDNSLCTRFDDFMDEHSLPRRSRDYDLRVEVRATVYLTRTGTDADNAAESLTREDVFAAISADDISWDAEEH